MKFLQYENLGTLIGCRIAEKILFSALEDEKAIENFEWKMELESSKLLHFALNPMIAGEFLTLTENGINLHEIDSGSASASGSGSGFCVLLESCREKGFSFATWANHPRKIIAGSNREAGVVDLRTGEFGVKFESKDFEQFCFCASDPKNSWLTAIVCENVVKLWDLRYPIKAAIQWGHAMNSPPTMFSAITVTQRKFRTHI